MKYKGLFPSISQSVIRTQPTAQQCEEARKKISRSKNLRYGPEFERMEEIEAALLLQTLSQRVPCALKLSSPLPGDLPVATGEDIEPLRQLASFLIILICERADVNVGV